MRSKNLILIILLLFSTITIYAQLKTEADGFVWEEFQENGKVGAKDKNGKVIISPKYKSIRYYFADDMNVTVGYFYVEDNKFKNGICDVTGQLRLPAKYDFAHLSVVMCGSDTLVYISSNNNDLKSRNLYDCSGNKIASKVPGFSAENDGYFYNFKTKENLNIKIPCANGKLSKFYTRNDHTFGTKTKDGMYAIYDAKGNIIVPPGKYDFICKHTSFSIIYYSIEKNGKKGACDEYGKEIIPPKYDNVTQYNDDGHVFYYVKLNGKKGVCDITGTEIIPPIYDDVYYTDGKYRCVNNDNQEDNEPQPSEGQSRQLQPQYASNSGAGSYTSSQSSSYTSPYSSSADKEYKPLNDPNLVDNSEKIRSIKITIEELENKRRYCASCNGTQKIPQFCYACKGTGMQKWGSYTPQYFVCNFCGGTGRKPSPCMICQQTSASIAGFTSVLKTLKETHGMTKEAHEAYLKIQAIHLAAQQSINSSSSASSSSGSSSSSSTCSYCNGTGYDPIAWHSGDLAPSVGGYTHSSGSKCVYCGSYEWHQHKYCPKCNADKW